MVMLTDLLERKRALEEEDARIQRKLEILRQIDDLASQLDDPELPVEPVIPDPPEPAPDHEVHAAADAPPKPAEAPPPPPAPPKPPAPPATGEAAKRGRRRSSGEVDKVLAALAHFRGEALQIDIAKKSGMASGQTSQVCAQLEADGRIKCVGMGGYQNKSKRWRLTEPPANGAPPISSRVRKAIERADQRAGRQPPTLEGRILSVLTITPGMTIPEVAAEVGVPASTVGRLVAKLKAEGEVIDANDTGRYRRVMS